MDANDKLMTERDANQVQRIAYNSVNNTTGVDGFIVGAVNRRITRAVSTTTIANDTETYNFYQNTSELLYTIRIVYTDGTRTDMLETQRTA